MTQKIHGFAHAPAQELSGGLPTFTVTVTGMDFTALTGSEEQHAADLDKVIEILSIRAQPVLIGKIYADHFNFAVEHNDIFGDLSAFNAEATAAAAAYKAGATVTVAKFDF